MLQLNEAPLDHAGYFVPETLPAPTGAEPSLGAREIERLLAGVPLRRRLLQAKQTVFRAGESRQSLFLVHSGFFKTSLTSVDGREKITGFRMRGDLLGLDSIGMESYACDAVALDTGEVWELPYAELARSNPALDQLITILLAAEIRRDWNLMLDLSTLSADQRVASFLMDLSNRLGSMGFSRQQMTLRMTRADLGSFLSLTLETVTRALTRLQDKGLIEVHGREIVVLQPESMHQLLH